MFSTSRTEAFSDGVLAIAITLLVLDLSVPARDTLHTGLWTALGHEWPSFVAYAVSFLTIGIMWVNHHSLLRRVRHVDRSILFANLALLMVIVVIPFPTKLLAAYLTEGGASSHTAAVVYGATLLASSLTFVLLYAAVDRSPGRIGPGGLGVRRSIVARFGVGVPLYALATAVGLINAPATLAISGAIALYYCADRLSTAGAGDEDDEE